MEWLYIYISTMNYIIMNQTMFASALPGATIIVFVSLWMEIRLDAWKMVRFHSISIFNNYDDDNDDDDDCYL